jgi:hypothetical protein
MPAEVKLVVGALVAKIIDYTQRTQPDIRGAIPRASGPGGADRIASMFGQAGSSLGRSFDVAAEAVSLRDEEQARAWSASVLSKARLDWAQQLADRQANAAPGAPDFTGTVVKDFDEYAKQTLETAPSIKSKLFLQKQLDELKTHIGESAIGFEAKARLDYRDDQFTESTKNLQKLMATDPAQYKIALAEQLALVDASAMPPVKRSAVRQKMIDDVSTAAVWSMIQKSPTRFLEDIGFMGNVDPATGKVRKSSGDLNGRTGVDAFDALPFQQRIHLFDQAIRLKAQTDSDVDRLAKQEKQRLSDEAMKTIAAANSDGKLNRGVIEQYRPILNHAEYQSALKMLDKPEAGQRTDPAAFAQLLKLQQTDPDRAIEYAFQIHRNGLLSNADLSSEVTRVRSIQRQEGPRQDRHGARAARRRGL